MMLSSHPQESGARQTSGELSEKFVSTPRFPQQIDEWQSLHEQFVYFKFESSAPQNKLSSHGISLKKSRGEVWWSLCPIKWHLPSKSRWEVWWRTLQIFLFIWDICPWIGPYLSKIPDKVINSTSDYPFKDLAWNRIVPTLGPRTKCLRLGL